MDSPTMDPVPSLNPDDVLDHLRQLTRQANATGTTPEMRADLAQKIAALFERLDRWLNNGGAQPANWAPRTEAGTPQSCRPGRYPL